MNAIVVVLMFNLSTGAVRLAEVPVAGVDAMPDRCRTFAVPGAMAAAQEAVGGPWMAVAGRCAFRRRS